MEIAKLKELLKTEYGIADEYELDEAMKKSAGINIGIFTLAYERNGYENSEQKEEEKVSA